MDGPPEVEGAIIGASMGAVIGASMGAIIGASMEAIIGASMGAKVGASVEAVHVMGGFDNGLMARGPSGTIDDC